MKISAIIPTLNEAPNIETSIRRAWECGADEVIVCDGGSTDTTVEIASQSKCALVDSNAGRGIQLNTGAAAATGDVLLFLHADTWLEKDGCQQIRKCIDQVDCEAGAFKQRIESSGFIYRIIEFGNGLRVRRLSMAYGDQGIFVTQKLFQKLGGFEDMPLMEDFSFSRRLKKHSRYKLLDGPLHVSARRWKQNGALRQTFRNWRTIWAYKFGAKSEDLARQYQNGKA